MKQVLQLTQLHSRQAHGNCSSDHTDAPVSTLSPFCKRKNFRLVTFCSISPSNCERKAWSFLMNAKSEFQNKCMCTFKGHHLCTAAQLGLSKLQTFPRMLLAVEVKAWHLTPALFTKFNKKCRQLLPWMVTLPLEGQDQHTITILLIQLCISFSAV